MLKNQRWLRIGGDTIDLGDLDSILRFVFVNLENHHHPNVRLVALDCALEIMITWDEDAEQESIEYDLERMIDFARTGHKIKLKRK